jgi:copper chaperone NosL
MSTLESVHVPVRPVRPIVRDRRRWTIAGLGAAGSALFAASYLLPWWNFHLVAPQYPKGLQLQIWLTGMSGDTREIDILNHYIGMHAITSAATTEVAVGGYLVGAVCLAVLAALLSAGRRVGWTALIPAIGLPVGFVADIAYHMWHFGHDLDPAAPLNFPTFTPMLLGPGIVGQFHTWAWPAAGFWMALSGLVLVIAAVVLRRRACADCPLRDACGATCVRKAIVREVP